MHCILSCSLIIACSTAHLSCRASAQDDVYGGGYSYGGSSYESETLRKMRKRPECHKFSKKGMIKDHAMNDTRTTPVHALGCVVRGAQNLVIAKTAEFSYTAHALKDGTPMWSQQEGLKLVACPTQGALFVNEREQQVIMVDYASGDTLMTSPWQSPYMEGYSCSELHTEPMPDDTPGFAWVVTPYYSHGGTPPSPYEEEVERLSRCCIRGTSMLKKDTVTSASHEYHSGHSYSNPGYDCQIFSNPTPRPKVVSEQEYKRLSTTIEERLKKTIPKEDDRPGFAQALEALPNDRILFSHVVERDCVPSPARLGIAKKNGDATWSIAWHVDVFVESFCPIP